MVCPLCDRRKGKRQCPAKAVPICAACCGSKRRVEVACPDDCAYLTGSHAGAWNGRETEMRRDARRIAPFLEGLDETEGGPLALLALASLPAIRNRLREVDDVMLYQALEVVERTASTRDKGILYEHSADDPRTQALVRELSGIFETQHPDADGTVVRPRDSVLARVLGALRRAVEATMHEAAGPTAFLDSATRLAGPLQAGLREVTSAPEPSARLIVPSE